MIEVKDIKKLYQIFQDEGIEKIQIQNGEDQVSFSISGGYSSTSSKKAPASPAAPVVAVPASETLAPATESKVYELRSGWIGFFTRLNPKNKESYVKLRDIVKKDDVVGHVRVLGVLQDLKAEQDGKLKEVLIEEGQPIEYGQPVMRFEAE